MEKITHLKDLLSYELQCLYRAEEHLQKALPELIKKATHTSLKNFMKHHISEADDHKAQLKEITDLLKRVRNNKPSKVVQTFIDEVTAFIQNVDEGSIDMVIITGLQKIETYKICGYNNACVYASFLGLKKTEKIFQKILEEERDERDLLNELMRAVLPARKSKIREGKPGDDLVASTGYSKEDSNAEEIELQSEDSTQNIQSPGGRAGSSHRSYSHGESRGH